MWKTASVEGRPTSQGRNSRGGVPVRRRASQPWPLGSAGGAIALGAKLGGEVAEGCPATGKLESCPQHAAGPACQSSCMWCWRVKMMRADLTGGGGGSSSSLLSLPLLHLSVENAGAVHLPMWLGKAKCDPAGRQASKWTGRYCSWLSSAPLGCWLAGATGGRGDCPTLT